MHMHDKYVQHVKECIEKASSYTSKLADDLVRNLYGMTGFKTRHFYNNLCSIEDARYLEIGTWMGSSLISALYENRHCKATVIDNWSEFGGNMDELNSNIKRFIPHPICCNIINSDCFALNEPLDDKFNIYLYDGAHDEISQRKAITEYYKYLDDIAIIIVDDWNHEPTRIGTFKGLDDVDANIHFQHEIRLTQDNTHTPMDIAKIDFWNGIGIFVIEKKPKNEN